MVRASTEEGARAHREAALLETPARNAAGSHPSHNSQSGSLPVFTEEDAVGLEAAALAEGQRAEKLHEDLLLCESITPTFPLLNIKDKLCF